MACTPLEWSALATITTVDPTKTNHIMVVVDGVPTKMTIEDFCAVCVMPQTYIDCLETTNIPQTPTAPQNAPGTAVENDVLHEEFFNGYFIWKYIGGAWVYQCGRDFTSGPILAPN